MKRIVDPAPEQGQGNVSLIHIPMLCVKILLRLTTKKSNKWKHLFKIKNVVRIKEHFICHFRIIRIHTDNVTAVSTIMMDVLAYF